MGPLVVEDVSTVEPKKNFVILCRVLAGIAVDKLGRLNSRIPKDSRLDSKKKRRHSPTLSGLYGMLLDSCGYR